jgi:hypothetical protein
VLKELPELRVQAPREVPLFSKGTVRMGVPEPGVGAATLAVKAIDPAGRVSCIQVDEYSFRASGFFIPTARNIRQKQQSGFHSTPGFAPSWEARSGPFSTELTFLFYWPDKKKTDLIL